MEQSQRKQTSIGDHVEYQKYSRITFPLLDHVTQRRFAVICMAGVLISALVSIVDAVRSRTAIPPYFEVSGFSMAPTLMGRSEAMRCHGCLFEGRFPIDQDGNRTRCQCPQCGNELDATGNFLAADRVKANLDSQQIKRWDLVAISGTNPSLITQRVVKRVIGMPGDHVDFLGNQLTINGKLVHDLPWSRDRPKPSVAVYRETAKGLSRWREEGNWLIYQHINPYRGSVPSRVLDDYAVNVNLSRRLEPVTELIVRFQPDSTPLSNPEIVIWKPNEDELSGVPVSETRPVAIRFMDDNYDPSNIEIRRCVVYRLRAKDNRSLYPIKLSRDEYFVLGDNVPISTDSRDWGPVSRDEILCTVTRFKHDEL